MEQRRVDIVYAYLSRAKLPADVSQTLKVSFLGTDAITATTDTTIIVGTTFFYNKKDTS